MIAGNVTSEKVANEIFRDIVKLGQISPKTLEQAEQAGFSFGNAEYARITKSNQSINASRFADSAQMNPKIKGDSARVLAMADAIKNSPPEVAGSLLALVINNTNA
ncbi:MAG: hypothetical protein ABH871_04680 [Pseudomonadota bacterium]